MTDKHFSKPPTCYLRRQVSGEFSKVRCPNPSSVVSRSAGLQRWTVSQGSLGGWVGGGETLILSQEKNQGQPEGEPGPMVSGHWLCLIVRKDLFLTVPLGDSYHGYKSIFGVCQSPVEYNEPRSCRDTHGRQRLTARQGLPMERTLITPTLQLRKVRLKEFTQAAVGGPGLKPSLPRSSAVLLYHQDFWDLDPALSLWPHASH